MSELNKDIALDSDETLEELFSHATRRPTPDSAAEAAVREVVRGEWQKVAGRQRRRQHVARFAIAASVLVAVFSLFSVFRPGPLELYQVADIQKRFGTISILGEESVLTSAHGIHEIYAGQTIVTEDDAGLALAWGNGGSVRFDGETRVEFTSDSSIYLHYGKVYFDSTPSELIASINIGDVPAFTVETAHGVVNHVGTQFMTAATDDALSVSVREGRVAIDVRYSQAFAEEGERLTFDGRAEPTRTNLSPYSSEWDWVGQTSPAVELEGKTIEQFLDWASREQGRIVEYAIPAVAAHAAEKTMVGVADNAALDSLRLLQTTALQHEIKDGGIIHVSYRE